MKGMNVSDDELRRCLEERWKPTRREDMPFSYKHGIRRYLGMQHVNSFPWLAVSAVDDFKGAWCAWCSLFSVRKSGGGHHNSGGQVLGALVQRPLVKFHNMTGKFGDLSAHHKALYHARCQEQATEFLKRSIVRDKKDVITLQDTSRKKAIEDNRKALRPIVETIFLCARQNIALRGHRDSGAIMSSDDPSVNEGNFRALLRYRMRGGDQVLIDHLIKGPRNAQYTSPEVQNGLLDAALQVLQKRLVRDINDAPCWSLLCDETTDRMHREQLCIVARYVSVKSGEVTIMEDPICLVDAIEEVCLRADVDPLAADVRLTGVNLAAVIKAKCESLGLNLSLCIGQGMDGAANMSSSVKGAAAELRKSAPMALYFHCMMHSFNLCASQSVSIEIVRNCVDVFHEMTTFFSKSAKRHHALQIAINECSEKPAHKRLIKLCETRFVERHNSILSALQLVTYVQAALHKLSMADSRDTRLPSVNLLHSIENFQFIVTLQTFSEISGLLIGVSRQLQSPNRDVIKALSYIHEIDEIISNKRQNVDCSFHEIFTKAEILAGKMNVSIKRPRIVKRSMYRANAIAACGDVGPGAEDQSVEDYYKVNMYIPVLDGLLSHIRDRFGPMQEKALSLGHIVPAYIGKDFADIEPALKIYEHFITSREEVQAEFNIWKHRWSNVDTAKEVNTAAAALQNCPALTMPNLHALLYVLATLPVTTAEPERVFSKVEKTASCVRNMGEERLESLILLQAHIDKTPSTDEVLDCFASSSARRFNLII